jgi:hypothetical protein
MPAAPAVTSRQVLYATAALIYVVGVALARDCNEEVRAYVVVSVGGLPLTAGLALEWLDRRRRDEFAFGPFEWIVIPGVCLIAATAGTGFVLVVAFMVGFEHCFHF